MNPSGGHRAALNIERLFMSGIRIEQTACVEIEYAEETRDEVVGIHVLGNGGIE